MNRIDLHASAAVMPAREPATRAINPARPLPSRPDVLQRRGKLLIVAGWAISIVGVVLYCVACFAAGSSAELGAMLTENVVPFARATLAVIGAGTLLWLVGSVTFLKGALDADEDGFHIPDGF